MNLPPDESNSQHKQPKVVNSAGGGYDNNRFSVLAHRKGRSLVVAGPLGAHCAPAKLSHRGEHRSLRAGPDCG